MARSAQHPTLAWLTHDGLSDAELKVHSQLGWLPVGSGPDPADEPDEGDTGSESGDDPDEPEASAPAGNASREAWAAYALARGATEADLDGLNRNDIRDTYGV